MWMFASSMMATGRSRVSLGVRARFEVVEIGGVLSSAESIGRLIVLFARGAAADGVAAIVKEFYLS